METKVLVVGGAVSGGVIAALRGALGTVGVITFKECPPGGRWATHEPIAVGGKLWEPIVEEHAAEDLLRGLAAGGDIEARIKAELPDLAPSGGHDALDELLGLLRVSRQQRDDAWKEIALATAQMKASNVQLEELRQQLAELNASMQKPAEDKATLSLFPEAGKTVETVAETAAPVDTPVNGGVNGTAPPTGTSATLPFPSPGGDAGKSS